VIWLVKLAMKFSKLIFGFSLLDSTRKAQLYPVCFSSTTFL